MRGRIVAACAAALVVLAMSPVARAHASCDQETPPDGSTQPSAPGEVSCDFNEPPALSSGMQVLDACGRRADSGEVSIVGLTMSVKMSATAPSTYLVKWHALSHLDGHRSAGSWSFVVAGTPAPCPSSSAAAGPGTAPATPGARTRTTTSGGRTPATTPAGGAPAPQAPSDTAASQSDTAAGDPVAAPGDPSVPPATGSPLGWFVVSTALLGAAAVRASRIASGDDGG